MKLPLSRFSPPKLVLSKLKLVNKATLSEANVARDFVFITAGIAGLATLAHLRVPLGFTPVPITGQTYGVAVVALTFGPRRSLLTVMTYLLLGEAGLPVLAQPTVPWHWGPTTGYLWGMLASSFILPRISKNMKPSFINTLVLCLLSSYIVFFFGLLALSFFLSSELSHQDLHPLIMLLTLGYLPFLPGDCVKIVAAALTVNVINKGKIFRRQQCRQIKT